MNSAVEQGVEPFRQAVGEGSVTAATAVSLDDMADCELLPQKGR